MFFRRRPRPANAEAAPMIPRSAEVILEGYRAALRSVSDKTPGRYEKPTNVMVCGLGPHRVTHVDGEIQLHPVHSMQNYEPLEPPTPA